ncbi:MAG: DUF3618 domain-containing protein [Rubrobacteraceae bacterium]
MEAGRGNVAEGFAGKILTWLGTYLISFIGIVHLLLSGEQFGYAAYLGLLFLANFGASAVAALGILWTGKRWAWLLGIVVAGGSLAVFLASRLFGLPDVPELEGQWFNLPAWIAVALELAFLATVPLALTRRGEDLVETEQARIDREKLPPARQETPEHFGLLEDEMREIRNHMAPDVSDLRAHLEPRKVGDRAKENVRARVGDFLRRIRGRGRR